MRRRGMMRLCACVVVIGAVLAMLPASAAAVTWWVSPSGSDSNLGTSEFPFRTIARAKATARGGDTVAVMGGRYPETVNLYSRHSGVEFRAVGEGRPVIDGGHRRAYGFHNAGADRVTIEGFEITGQTEAGIYAEDASQTAIEGNLIHHVGSGGEPASNGVRLVHGTANTIARNTVHHIGPGYSAMGIYLVETRNALVEGNSVYLVRKEGIRDWKGLDNRVVANSTFLNWVGIALNTSTGTSVRENHAFDNVDGIVVKHASYRTVLDYWDLDTPHWTRVEHNTVERSSEASLWIAQSDEPLDYVEVQANRFAGAGGAFLRDVPSLRGPHVTVDQNAYSETGGWAPRWLYRAGWRSEGGLTDWDSVRRETGWEMNPPAADAGMLRDPSAAAAWTQFRMTPIDSSSKDTYWTRNHLDATADDDQTSYWLTATSSNEYVIFDLGQPQTFNHVILTLYGHDDVRNPRGYRFAVSDDLASWQTVLSGANGDTSQAARYYELAQPVTAQYLRFVMVDTFCDAYFPRLGCGENFVLSDLKVGFVAPQESSQLASGAPAAGGGGLLFGLLPRARLTRKGALRIGVKCDESAAGAARIAVADGGRKRVLLEPGCRRKVDVPLRRRFVKRLRRGEIRRVRVVATDSTGARMKKRLRVRA